MATGRGLRLGEALFGGGLVALGGLIAVSTALTPTVGRAGAVGPALFPYLVAAGLGLVGLAVLREARGGAAPHTGGLELDGRAVALLTAALLVQALLIDWLGWIPTAALLFMGVARAFGERRMALNALIGVALAAATFAVFNYALDLNLPVGSLADLMQADP